MWLSFPSSLKLHSTNLLKNCSCCEGFPALPTFNQTLKHRIIFQLTKAFLPVISKVLRRIWIVSPALNVLDHWWWCPQSVRGALGQCWLLFKPAADVSMCL